MIVYLEVIRTEKKTQIILFEIKFIRPVATKPNNAVFANRDGAGKPGLSESSLFACLSSVPNMLSFVLILYAPINNVLAMSGRIFLCLTCTK